MVKEWNQRIAENSLRPHPAYSQTYIHPDASVQHCVIDDTDGPVFIDRDVRILLGARIKGPIVILEGSLVKMSSELYSGTTFVIKNILNGKLKNLIINKCCIY